MHISGGARILDSRQFIRPWQYTLGGEAKAKVSDIGRTKKTFFKIKFQICFTQAVKKKLQRMALGSMVRGMDEEVVDVNNNIMKAFSCEFH